MEYVSDDGKCVRCDRVDDVKEFVKSSQLMAMMKHHLTAYVSNYKYTRMYVCMYVHVQHF